MERAVPPLPGDGGSASDGRGPRGQFDLRSLYNFVATRVREGYQNVLGREVPIPRPPPRQEALSEFLSPSARSVILGPAMGRHEAEQLKNELQCAIDDAITSLELYGPDIGKGHKMLLEMISSCSDDVKYSLEVGVRCNKILAEDAAELRVLMAKMDETMKERILRGWAPVSIISDIWEKFGYTSRSGSLISRIKKYIDLCHTIQDFFESLRHGPGLFKHIGKEAKGVLYNEYMSSSLRVDPQPNLDQCVAGWGQHHQNTFKSLIMNFKLGDANIDIIGNRNAVGPNALINSSLLAKIKLDNMLGAQTKGVMYLPFPYRNAKFELQSMDRFAGLTASVGLHPNPGLNFSCLLGTKVLNCGGMIDINTETSQSILKAGLSARSGPHSLGLTMTNLGLLIATYHRNFTDNNVHISAMASHCCSTMRTHVMVGGMQLLEGDLTVKARVSSSGFVCAMVKKVFGGNCAVGLTSEVNLRDLRRVPSFGIVFSVGRGDVVS